MESEVEVEGEGAGKEEGLVVGLSAPEKHRLRLIIATMLLFFFMFLPMILVAWRLGAAWKLGGDPEEKEPTVQLIAAGFITAVVLRSMLRGFLRALIRSALRIITRTTLRTYAADALRIALRDEHQTSTDMDELHIFPGPGFWKVVRDVNRILVHNRPVAFVATLLVLAGAFVWVYRVNNDTDMGALQLWGRAFVYMLVPLGIMYAFELRYCRGHGLSYNFTCPMLSILLQLVFAFSHSFIPLLQETFVRGTLAQKAAMAEQGLVGLLGSTLLFVAVGVAVGLPLLVEVGIVCSLFLLLNSFPLKPFPGSDLWRHDRRRAGLFMAVSILLTTLIPHLAELPFETTPLLEALVNVL